MSQSSSSASQPSPSPMPGIVSQGLEASASLGNFFPSTHSQFQDATNLWGLNLPPNDMRALAQCQTLGQLPPALVNRPVQPPSVAGATKSSFATARTRSIARSHSQPNAPKSRGPSAYARGVPIPKPVPQPSKADNYKSPLLKAHARRTKSKVKATMAPVASGSTSASESQPDPSHLAMAKAITEQPGLGEIPIDLLVHILPSLIETIESNKAGRRSNSSVESDVRTSETGILMADSESASRSDIRVPTMEVPPVQLPVSSSLIVQPEQSPLIAQFQSVPATGNNDTDSSMAISAVIPTTQFPDWYPTINIPEGQSAVLPCFLDLEHSLATESAPSDVGPALLTCSHLEGALSAVPNSQGSAIEPVNGAGEARTDSDSIDRFIDEILDGNLECFVDFECLERV